MRLRASAGNQLVELDVTHPKWVAMRRLGTRRLPPTPFNPKGGFFHPKLDRISYLTNKKRGAKSPPFLPQCETEQSLKNYRSSTP